MNAKDANKNKKIILCRAGSARRPMSAGTLFYLALICGPLLLKQLTL